MVVHARLFLPGVTAGGGGSTDNVQVFASSGTWVKPASGTTVTVQVFGGGGAGGGGRNSSSGTNASGGAGGGAGAHAVKAFAIADLAATEPVVVGAGGVCPGPGSAGGDGGASTFSSGGNLITAGGGGGGTQGSSNAIPSAGSGGTATGGDTNTAGGSGGRGGTYGTNTPHAGVEPGGGGGGGGIVSGTNPDTSGLEHFGKSGADSTYATGGFGGEHNINYTPTNVGGAQASTPGANNNSLSEFSVGGGGGGGMAARNAVGSLEDHDYGQDGGFPGGGGGGGGGERNSSDVGRAGGDGGAGFVVVVTSESVATVDYDAAVLADSPIGYWNLQEASGTTAADQATAADDGTYTPGGGAITYRLQGPNPNATGLAYAIETDGTSSYVSFPAQAELSVSSAQSFEIWFWLPYVLESGLSTGEAMIGSDDSDQKPLLYRAFTTSFGSEVIGGYGSGSGRLAAQNIAIAPGWHHYVVTYAGTNNSHKIYVDGVEVSVSFSSTNEGMNATQVFYVGNDSGLALSTSRAAGLAIYDTELTSTQVATHYAVGAGALTLGGRFNG